MYVFSNENCEKVFRHSVEGTQGKPAEKILEQIQENMIRLDSQNGIMSEDNWQVLELGNSDYSMCIHFLYHSIDIGDYIDD